MKIPSNISHDKQYADKILEITADTMFFVYKDGTCLDFKANTTDFFIKEQDIIGRNIFSYFPVETAREMYAEFIKVRAGDKPSARNYKLILEDDVKYYKCISIQGHHRPECRQAETGKKAKRFVRSRKSRKNRIMGIRFVHTALHLLGIHPDIL